jgi:hypothetical protein
VVTISPGDRLTVSGGATYYWQGLPMTTSADIWWTHQQRNDVTRDPLPITGIPTANSNTDVLRASLQQDYRRDRWNFATRVNYMKRSANEFSPELAGFIPPKKRWEVMGLAGYQVSETCRFDLRVARIWTKEDATPGLVVPNCCEFPEAAVPVIKQNAWAFALGASVLLGPGLWGNSRRQP